MSWSSYHWWIEMNADSLFVFEINVKSFRCAGCFKCPFAVNKTWKQQKLWKNRIIQFRDKYSYTHVVFLVNFYLQGHFLNFTWPFTLFICSSCWFTSSNSFTNTRSCKQLHCSINFLYLYFIFWLYLPVSLFLLCSLAFHFAICKLLVTLTQWLFRVFEINYSL